MHRIARDQQVVRRGHREAVRPVACSRDIPHALNFVEEPDLTHPGVVAVDNDPDCIGVVVENAERNGMADRVAASTTDVGDVCDVFPVVVANIEARVLIPMAPALGARVAPGGLLVLSGVLAGQEDDELRAAA